MGINKQKQVGTKVPAIRFDGFRDEWTESKLGDMLDYEQPTKYLVDSDDYSDDFDTPVLTAGKTFLLGFTDETDGIYDKGDVILFDDFTTAFHHIEFPFKVKSSATKFLTTTSDDYNLRFLYESMKGIQYPTRDHKRYWISEYQTLRRNVPQLTEQLLIGDFFKTIDDLISAEKEQLENYEQYKEAMLQKMFPKKGEVVPEIRFDGFRDEWTQTKLGEVVDDIYQPKTLSKNSMIPGEYPVFGANGYIGYHNEYNHKNEQVGISCRGANSGDVNLIQDKVWITGNTMVVNLDNILDLNKLFLYYVLSNQNLKYMVSGSAQPQIVRSDVMIHRLILPTFEEQILIGNFFKTIDDVIRTKSNRIDELTNRFYRR